MAFIVWIIFLTFLSIKIRFGFSEVTLIFSGAITHSCNKPQKWQGKIFSIKSTQLKFTEFYWTIGSKSKTCLPPKSSFTFGPAAVRSYGLRYLLFRPWCTEQCWRPRMWYVGGSRPDGAQVGRFSSWGTVVPKGFLAESAYFSSRT